MSDLDVVFYPKRKRGKFVPGEGRFMLAWKGAHSPIAYVHPDLGGSEAEVWMLLDLLKDAWNKEIHLSEQAWNRRLKAYEDAVAKVVLGE